MQKNALTGETDFVRTSSVAGLYEKIWIWTGGKTGETVYAHVAISVVRGMFGRRYTVESELVSEIAKDQKRGWTQLRSTAEARQWEDDLCVIAPAQVVSLANRKGPILLERTEEPRKACEMYLAYLKSKVTDQVGLEQWLDSQIASNLQLPAESILGCPGVVISTQSEPFYRLSALSILALCGELEGLAVADLVKIDALENVPLLLRLDILADLIQQNFV